jgi:rhodanese-related sulfurtransferase
MDGSMSGFTEVRDLTADEVAEGLSANQIMLVDVREPNETALERFPGAVLLPLSRFDPQALPDPAGRTVVFACAGGIRSARAAEAAIAMGLPYDAHLAGGLKAWKVAGFPTEQ